MTADIDQLTREALALEFPDGTASRRDVDTVRNAIRFTLSRYAPHELPDDVPALAEKLESEWREMLSFDRSAHGSHTAFIIRRTREEDAKGKPNG